jgi:SAM-dependent methyltransferase
MLQLGFGAEAWLTAFQSYGWETRAIEPLGDTTAARDTRLDVIPTEPAFDFAIVYHALERGPRPLDTLRDISRALRPGGHCLISVPRLDTLAAHGQIRYCLRPGKHIVAFTEACLRGLAARAGLQTVATLHELDYVFTPGEPLRLRLLTRKIESPTSEPEPFDALAPVLAALSGLEQSQAAPAGGTTSPKEPSECPACAGSQVAIVREWRLSGSRAHAAACSDCGLLFTFPQPDRNELQMYYAPEGGWQASRSKKAAAPAETWRNTAVSVMLDALDRYLALGKPPTNARVFDFGCGPGNWLDALQEYGWDTYGLEPSSEVAFARHKRLLAVPSEPQFHLVLVYHVLEHLPRPLDTLRQLTRTLLPGGHCFISVPRIDTLGAHRQVDYCLHARHHIVAFTEACLRGLLARSGLEVLAAFHELDARVSKGLPLRLRLLARKTETPLMPQPVAASALKPVIEAFADLRRRSA